MTIPRSALLAAWAGAVAAGRAGTADALLAVAGDDEPHTVEPAPGFSAPSSLPVPDPGYLSDLLVLLSAAGERGPVQVRCVLPAPGDVRGVPGPPELLAAAVDAGECVLVEGLPDGAGRTSVALVPEVEEFGPDGDVGVRVAWHAFHAAPVVGTPLATSVAEADMAFRLALAEATSELEGLDLSSWRPDATAGLRGRGGTAQPLPPTLGPRSLRLLDRAERVMAILAVAGDDPGGAVTGWEAGRRSASLSELSRATRAAVVAAVSLPG